MQRGLATGSIITLSLAVICQFPGCESSRSPVRSEEYNPIPVTLTDGGDPSGISHLRTYFSMAHQGIAVDNKYIYGIHRYFISVTDKESGRSASHVFLISNSFMADYSVQMSDYNPDDVYLLAPETSSGDAFYFGGFERFRSLLIDITRAGTGEWNIAWEYWNGSQWSELEGISDATNGFRNLGGNYILYNFPEDWERSSIQGEEAFYIRALVTSISYMTTNPVAGWALVGRYCRNDAQPASEHYSDGSVESAGGTRYLYVIGPGNGSSDGRVVRYSTPELEFDGIEHSWTHGRGDFSGVDKHVIGGTAYWWVIWDITDLKYDYNVITRYNPDWTNPVDYRLKYLNAGRYNYQGFTWWSNGINNYIFANMHGPFGTTDLYKWNGQGFTALDRIDQVHADGFEASQGLTWEENTDYLWCAARGNDVFGALKCKIEFINDSNIFPNVNTEH